MFAHISSAEEINQQLHLRMKAVLDVEIRQGGGEGGHIEYYR